MDTKDMTQKAYEEKAEAQLKQLHGRVLQMQAQFKEMKADANIKLSRQLDDMQKQYASAREQLDELSDSAKDAWGDLRDGVDNAIGDLRKSVESATEKLSG